MSSRAQRKVNRGFQGVVEMLRVMNLSEQKRLLSLVCRQDPELAALLVAQVAQFEDLQYLSPKELQYLLKEVDIDLLALALRGQPEIICLAFMRGLSQRMQGLLQEQLAGNPQPKSKVEEAREKIIDIAKRLEQEGKLLLRSSASEEMVG